MTKIQSALERVVLELYTWCNGWYPRAYKDPRISLREIADRAYDVLQQETDQCEPDVARETTITKEQLDKLWNALEYTLGTISNGCLFESESNPEYVEIHRGRAVQSRRFLTNAKSTVNKLLNDLKEVNEPHAGEQQ